MINSGLASSIHPFIIPFPAIMRERPIGRVTQRRPYLGQTTASEADKLQMVSLTGIMEAKNPSYKAQYIH